MWRCAHAEGRFAALALDAFSGAFVPPLRIILLPGLDGTGELFALLIDHLPDDWTIDIVDYPRDAELDFEQHLDLIDSRIEPGVRHIVIAESFSGPLAIAYAHRRPGDIAALVLCATFIRNPLPVTLCWLPRLACPLLMRMPLPGFIARMFLIGAEAPGELLRLLKTAAHSVAPRVLAARIRMLASIEVSNQLAALKAPILYFRAEHDRLVGARNARDVCAAAPHAVIKTIDAPHLVFQTKPQESATAITAFLRNLCA